MASNLGFVTTLASAVPKLRIGPACASNVREGGAAWTLCYPTHTQRIPNATPTQPQRNPSDPATLLGGISLIQFKPSVHTAFATFRIRQLGVPASSSMHADASCTWLARAIQRHTTPRLPLHRASKQVRTRTCNSLPRQSHPDLQLQLVTVRRTKDTRANVVAVDRCIATLRGPSPHSCASSLW